jgi:hypothetical protein
MRPLRAFLLLRLADGEWEVTTHRDLESIEEAWKARAGPAVSAALHVGFWRPDTSEFESTLVSNPGHVLLSASARHALPPDFASSRLPVGKAGGLPLFLALSGWGYDASEPNSFDDAPSETSSAAVAAPADPASLEDWFAALAASDPELAAEASTSGIRDERSYLALENSLPSDLREQLGLARFRHYAGGTIGPEHILDFLVVAPPWLLSLPVSILDLSVRAKNVFGAEKIAYIGDLAPHGTDGVMRFSNFGRKTCREICEQLCDLFTSGPSSARVAVYLRKVARRAEAPSRSLPEPAPESADTEASAIPVYASFNDALTTALSLLTSQETRLVAMRMGLRGAAMTLHEIGETIGVTRERIRQIEGRCVEKMRSIPAWDTDLSERLDALLFERKDGLPLEGLAILDPWFSGVSERESVFGFVAERLPKTPFHLIREGHQTFVSRIKQQVWLDAVRSARRILEGQVGRRTPIAEARDLVEGVLVGDGEELRSELWHAATRHAHFGDDGSGAVLISYGFAAEHLVEAVLDSSDRPLHYTEIRERLGEAGNTVDPRRIRNAAAVVGLLFGRGVYGAQKHFPLSEAETRLLVAEAEDVVEGQSPGRQWHAREICEAMEERGMDFGGRIDAYVVSIALRGSEHMNYLGRMVWASSASGAKGTADRLDVHQAIVSILMHAGGPLSRGEIKVRLSRERGLNSYFQIWPEGPVVRVGLGMWGLMGRDLPFSSEEAENVVREMRRILGERGKGLHVSEIRDAVSPHIPAATAVADPALFLGLAQKSEGFSVACGQYLYLAEWGGPRRVTVKDAALSVLREAGATGISADEAVPRIEALIERPYPKNQYGSTCNNLGARYDEATGNWRLPADDADTEEPIEESYETA